MAEINLSKYGITGTNRNRSTTLLMRIIRRRDKSWP